MTDSKFCWSEETYRLDELERSVDFPQLIQVTEGIDTGNDIDSFSAEDILMIDQSVVLQKVAAQFAEKRVEVAESGDEYEILKEEILIPLNYKGKLKVMTPVRRYYSVRQLARDFPRYATVLEALRAPTENGGIIDIKAGSKVELDRVIPAQKNVGDRLVIFTEVGGRQLVALEFDARGKFRSCPDDNEYTLKEVIDRYSLPQVIEFLDNKIQKIYTQDLLEGVEQMANVTASALQINRLCLQRVLLGHYTEPSEDRNPSEKFCKRTLVVIPLDLFGIREITVKVRLGNAEDDPIYESFLVRNVNAERSDYADVAEGLYVEFVKRPRIIRLKEEEEEAIKTGIDDIKTQEEDDGPPPPVPPRPGKSGHGDPPPVMPKPRPKPKKITEPALTKTTETSGKRNDYFAFNLDKKIDSSTGRDTDDELSDYEIPENPPISPNIDAQRPPAPSPRQKAQKLSSSSTAANKPTSPMADSQYEKENIKTEKNKERHVANKLAELFKGKKSMEGSSKVTKAITDNNEEDDVDSDEGNVYDEPDDMNYHYAEQQEVHTQKQNITGKAVTMTDIKDIKQKPVAFVSPQTGKEQVKPKEFRMLKCDELKERLITCGMSDFATFCAQEKIDGEFLHGIDKATMKTLGLSKYYEQKLKRIIAGWVPTT